MVNNLPVNSDPLIGLHRIVSYYNQHNHYYQDYMANYPVASDQELLTHYMYGSAGPFIDLLTYVDLGVGWTLKPVDFDDEDEGLEAVQMVEEELHKRDFNATMMQFAVYYLVLGRACLIKTHDKLGDFYFDENSRISGIDCINPLTLDKHSVREVMDDNTGKKEFIQQYKDVRVSFTQDRVVYRANNNFNKHSAIGFSSLQRCISELRLLSRFPGYRESLARKYANIHRIIHVKTEEFGKTDQGKAVLNSAQHSMDYLDDVARFYTQQEERGGALFFYDWMDVKEASYAGKEVNLNDLELQTLRNIAFKLDVPLDMLMYSQIVNRSVMEVLADIFVNKQAAGARNYVYTPIIEDLANEILQRHEVGDGRLEVEYNPFLSRNLVEAAAIIRDVWPTGSLTLNDIRSRLDLPPLSDEELKENKEPEKNGKV